MLTVALLVLLGGLAPSAAPRSSSSLAGDEVAEALKLDEDGSSTARKFLQQPPATEWNGRRLARSLEIA